MTEIAALNIQTIARKYNLESPCASSSTRGLTPQELDDILVSHATKPDSSQSAAMRALQQKLQTLEKENSALKSSAEHVQGNLNALQEQVGFLNRQVEFLNGEKERVLKQHEIDRENWASEVERLRDGQTNLQDIHRNEIKEYQEEIERLQGDLLVRVNPSKKNRVKRKN